MTTVVDHLRLVTIEASSPDASVRARLRVLEGVTVELAPDVLTRHTEESLAAHTQAALAGLYTGYAAVAEKLFGPDDHDPVTVPPRTAMERYRHRVNLAIEDVSAVAPSPSGAVTIAMYGSGDVAVRFAPGCLSTGGMDATRLADEIAAAVAEATNEHTRLTDEIRRNERTNPASTTAG